MYLPRHFAVDDPAAVLELVRACPLASVVTHDTAGLDANPVVLLADAAADARLLRLRGHVARANPLWRRAAGAGCDALALFHGAQAYVSPSAHPRKALDGKVVPTWNYLVVQIRGRLRAIDDAAWVRSLVQELTSVHEASRATPWAVDDAPPDYVQAMLDAVVGVEIEVRDVTAKFKLSQNHPAAARVALAQDLGRGGEQARELSARMLRAPGVADG